MSSSTPVRLAELAPPLEAPLEEADAALPDAAGGERIEQLERRIRELQARLAELERRLAGSAEE